MDVRVRVDIEDTKSRVSVHPGLWPPKFVHSKEEWIAYAEETWDNFIHKIEETNKIRNRK